MNVILFITIIILVLIFGYRLMKFAQYKLKEDFKLEIDTTWVDDRNIVDKKLTGARKRVNKLSELENMSPHTKVDMKYDQSQEFIPDKENYTIYKDTGLMIDIEKPIKLNSVEFDNLLQRLDYYRSIEKNNRYGDSVMALKKNMINQQEGDLRQNYPIVRKELSLLKMDRIVSAIFKNHQFSIETIKTTRGPNSQIDLNSPHDIKINLESLESYRFIKHWLLEQLSNEALRSLYAIKYVNSDRFKFKHDKIINYYIDYENNLERFEMQGIIFRDNKEHNFFIYFDIIFDSKFINYYINNMIILGINIEQTILFADLLDKDYKLDNQGIHLSLSRKNPGYVSDKYINNYGNTVNKFVEDDQNARKSAEKKSLNNGYCFYKDAPDKNTCISYTKRGGVGIWDTPCRYNEECPFYKKNLNYPNSRGGCINGFCEMPVNIKTLGYKEYNEGGENAAICYNCKHKPGCKGIECSQCCEDQEQDQTEYSLLKSPDYAFSNDYFERIKYSSELKKNGLAPIKIRI